MHIPFSPPYIDEDVINEVNSSLRSGWITTGPKVKELENLVAGYCGVDNALAVNSATSAMMLVLHWYGIAEGDEVIVPAYTYCATALAVMHAGATPVMVDVKEDFTIDADAVAKAITPATKAIITVDFAGWPCSYDEIYNVVNNDEIKNKFIPVTENQQQLGRILVMADAAHSLGAVYKNKPSGAVADISVFSFHAVKNTTTAEGGVITFNMPHPFNNKNLYDTMRLWSLNGQTKDAFTKSVAGGWKYDIVYPGFKINLPDVLAAIGVAQMRKYADYILPRRKEIFALYNQEFSKYSWAILPPFVKDDCASSYHIYPLRIKNISEELRDKIIEKISGAGVSVNVHFIPMPLLSIFKNAGFSINDFPVSYSLYKNEITLPLYPQLTDEQCMYIIQTVSSSIDACLAHEK